MKKTILIALALVLVIGGSAMLYNYLADMAEAPNRLGMQEQSTVTPDGQSPESTENKRMAAPDFTVQDAEGNSVKLSDLFGKPIVLNFWATWCPPCRSEMPDFNAVFEELGEDIHFVMLDAVDGTRETREIGEAYVAEQGFTFPVYYDMEQEAVIQYGIRAFPTTIFIDSEGYVAAGAEGAIDQETLRKGIDMIAQ
jgi:Thiol-disulfide isomerase and thioredoxins